MPYRIDSHGDRARCSLGRGVQQEWRHERRLTAEKRTIESKTHRTVAVLTFIYDSTRRFVAALLLFGYWGEV